MRADVHQAALKAAAKVAFSIVFLNGCGGSLTPADSRSDADRENGSNPPAPSASASSTETPSPSSTATTPSKNPVASNDDAGPDLPPKTDAGSGADATPPDCASTLAATFPPPDEYRWTPEARSKDVVACCLGELTTNGELSAYRWGCCVAYDENDPNKTEVSSSVTNMACTPWGPPVPPSMTRSRRARPEIAAWIAKAMVA